MSAAQWNTQSTPSNACSMLAGSQISPTIDTSFLRSPCPNQIIKIALIKLTDTKREVASEKETPDGGVKVKREKINKQTKRCARDGRKNREKMNRARGLQKLG
jgi:hypothetical protein